MSYKIHLFKVALISLINKARPLQDMLFKLKYKAMCKRSRRLTNSKSSLYMFLYLQNHKPTLAQDELTTVRRNLHTNGVEVDNDFVSMTTGIRN